MSDPQLDAFEAALKLALTALPDSDTAGPEGTGYKYAWDELTGDEQEWVKQIRRAVIAVLDSRVRT